MKLLIVLISLLALGLSGCSKSAKRLTGDDGDGDVRSAEAPEGQFEDGLSGGIADFYVKGSSDRKRARNLEKYVYERTLNNPSEVRIRLSLEEEEDTGLYTGYLNISYYDDGYFHMSNQDTGFDKVDVKYNRYDGHLEYKYNQWITSNGDSKFRAMFSDEYGAVVLVIDKTTDLGDGIGPDDKVGGKVYYKNFGNLYAGSSPTRCWFVYAGPYQCGAGYESESKLYPEGDYTLLGEFKGLSLKEAFNLED